MIPSDQQPECARLGIRPIGTRPQHTAVLMATTSNYSPIIVVILNNEGMYGALRQKERFPPEHESCSAAFRKGCGVRMHHTPASGR